jgi:hypothetical protein
VPINLDIDDCGRVTRFDFGAVRRRWPDLGRVAGELETLGDVVAAVATTDGRRVLDVRGDLPLAVGSGFKLCVLAVLAECVARRDVAWDNVIAMTEKARSLPSGILHRWPAGTPLTVQSVATLMISLSDNTAADLLADLVGRSALEARSPRNRPFLTTREFFVLRSPGADDLLERWRGGDLSERRAVIQAVADRPLPPAGGPSRLTHEPSVEWWFTAAELCDLLTEVEHFPGMSVDQGLADPLVWPRIAFKGGWEPGAMSWTTAVQSTSGQRHALALVANSPATGVSNERRLTALYREALDALPT